MHSRRPTIRDMPPPPHIVGLQHFTTYAEIDEILRSRSFRQGSHQESQPFFGRTLLTIDGDEHFERRRLEAPLFAKAALDYYEHSELIPLIGKTLQECRANRGDDGVVRADLCVVLRTMLARIAAGERVACLFTPANRDPAAFGADARVFNPSREVGAVKPWGLTFGGGQHICIGRTLVTGLSARTDNDEGTDGTVVNIAGALYDAGVEIDDGDPPSYTQASHHDAYGRFPMLLTRL